MSPAPHLVLRADATSTIGTGHAMRLLALAQAWVDGGGDATLLTREVPDWVAGRYVRDGVGVDRIAVDDDDATALVDVVAGGAAAVAAVDGPHVDAAYLDALAPIAGRTLVVDDMAALERYPVGLLLNQNAHADRARYPADAGTRYLLGLDYTLLRREFRTATPREDVAEHGRRVLVTFGGADPAGMTLRTLEALTVVGVLRRDLEVTVLVGPANPLLDVIAGAVDSAPFAARLERSVDDMTSRIAWADLAVASAGSTVWELARLGCPALVVETAPAEPYLATGLAGVGLFDSLGPADELSTTHLAAAITDRLDDRDWRAAMAARGPALVDGQGAERVAGVLREVAG